MDSICGRSGVGNGGTYSRCNFLSPGSLGGAVPQFIQLESGTEGYKTDWNNFGPRFGFASSLLVSIAVAIGYTAALILISLRQWLRARRRIRRPTEVTVSEWPDRLDLIGIGKLDPIPLTSIRRTISTRTHLLFEADQDVVILPRRAFVEDGALEELARKVEGIPRADAVPAKPLDKPPVEPAPPPA